MSAEKTSKPEPIIRADSHNITTWNHHLKDNVLRLGLSRIMSPDEVVRIAGALDLNDFSPDAESSVDPDHATAVFGTYSFTQIYESARAIQSRFQSSDRHGVIYCINRLMNVKMKDETVVGAHTFTDDVSSLMLRLKGHLREGGVEVLTVMEIMVLIEGLPKSGPFALFALACSTDETLTATQFIERLHRQAERLAREQTSLRVSKALMTEDADGLCP